jgi:hypothetical protein
MDPPGPSTTDQGAYLAYLQPLQPPVSSLSSNIVDRTLDYYGSAHYDKWNSLAGPTDGQLPRFVYPIDSNHNSWALMPHCNSPPNNNGVADLQTGMSVGGIRIGGVDSTNQQRGSLPPFYGNRLVPFLFYHCRELNVFSSIDYSVTPMFIGYTHSETSMVYYAR